MKTITVYDAQHPIRQIAIRIIEQIIEPCLLSENNKHKGVEGKAYYKLEDKIVELLLADEIVELINAHVKKEHPKYPYKMLVEKTMQYEIDIMAEGEIPALRLAEEECEKNEKNYTPIEVYFTCIDQLKK